MQVNQSFSLSHFSMPSGRTHDRITLWALPCVGALVFTLTGQALPTLWICAGYLFGGLMLSPDLDIHSVQYKRWGIFRWIWLPYRGSLRHRSAYSHGPLMGTTIRVIYLLIWISFIGFAGVAIANELLQMNLTWGGLGQFIGQWLWFYRVEVIAFCIGLEVGSFSHYTADWIVSSLKRMRRKKEKRQAHKPKQ
jgi:uncharacterized metal-binding protein